MDPADLPVLGVIANPTKDSLDLFSRYVKVGGCRVLCIGYSGPELKEFVEPYRPAEIVCLTHWTGHRDAALDTHRLVLGDICSRTEFRDDEFDAALLFSVAEHLHDLDGAYAELKRIVRHRGHVVSMFGGAWSCAYGHHLYANPDDPKLNFVLWQLPAHIHLLCSHEEICTWYRQAGYGDDVCRTVLHWFYETNIINRVFFDDHLRAMSQYFQIVASEAMYNDLPVSHLAALRELYPAYVDFSTYGGNFLLRVVK